MKAASAEKSMRTYSYRIKDAIVSKKLDKLARAVNFVWNYCNETSFYAIKNRSKFLSKYDFRASPTSSASCVV